jgi:hypothetical protein
VAVDRLTQINFADLYLACAAGDVQAIEAFERTARPLRGRSNQHAGSCWPRPARTCGPSST